MKCLLLLSVLLLAGCANSKHQVTACWFPERRTATTNDVALLTTIVSSLRPGKVALREITGYESPPVTNAPQSTKFPLPVPPKPVFREYAISETAQNAVFVALMKAGPLLQKDSGTRGREVFLYLADGRPYGEVLVLELLADDGVLVYLEHREDFTEDLEVLFSIPGLGEVMSKIITEQVNSK